MTAYFIGHLGPAEDDDERTLRILELLAEIAQFLLHQEPDRARGHEFGNAGGGGVGAMGRSERVVDIDIGQLRELLAERVVVGFFLVVIAEIFQQRDFAVLEFRGGLLGLFADAIIDELDRHADQGGQRRNDRGQALFRIAFALGPAQVRAEENAGALFDQVLDGRHGFPDALVVGDDLDAVLFLEWNVVVDADENALALERDVADGDFGHRFLKFDGITELPNSRNSRNFWRGRIQL